MLNEYNQLTDINNVRNELQQLISTGVSPEGSGGNIKTALNIFGTETKTVRGSKRSNEQLEERLRSAGVWHTGELGSEMDGGIEHIVYDNNTTVNKVNYTQTLADMREYLYNIAVYNALFPETAYKLSGFKLHQGKISPVVTQPYVENNSTYDQSAIDSIMLSKGFNNVGDVLPVYRNNSIGVTIWDINPGNVLFKDGLPIFIDPRISIDGTLLDTIEKDTKVDKKLDKKVGKFISKIGGKVIHSSYTNQPYKARVDTLAGIVEVVDGKVTIDTLGHEATHMFLDLLPDDSVLLRDIIKDIKNRPEYKEVYELYKNFPEYIKNGEVDEVKMAKETAAHIIDDIIVQRYNDKKALKWWERLWNYIKDLLSGKKRSDLETIAEDILGARTRKLSKEKIRAIREANRRGEVYYELSERDESYIKGVRSIASDPQKKVIDDLVLNPKVKLDGPTHIYSALNDDNDVYKAVSVLLHGKTTLNEEDYALNKNWGNDFDAILQGIALGKKLSEIKGIKTLPEDMHQRAFDILTKFYNEVRGPGDIILTQVIVSDPVTKVAGSIDLLVVHPDGSMDVIDLKTMRKGRSYTSPQPKGEGSVFDEELSRKQKHAIQVATYRRLLAAMGYPGAKISAIYVDLAIEGEKKQQMLHGFDKGVRVPFTETSWDTYARKIVPTEPIQDKNKAENLYTEEEIDNKKEDIDTTTIEPKGNIEQVIEGITETFSKRLAYFESLIKGGNAYRPQQTTINDINYLLYSVRTDMSKNQMTTAYGKILVHAQDEVNRWTKYINDPEKQKSNNYYNVVDEVSKFIESYRKLLNIKDKLNEGQQEMARKLQLSLIDLEESIVTNSWNYVLQQVSKELPGVSTKDVEALLSTQQDITKQGLWTSDLAGSRDKLAATLDRVVKRALDGIHRNTDKMFKEINELGDKFYTANGGKLSKESFSFLYEKDGKMVIKISPEYYKIQAEVYAPLKDDNGKNKEWIHLPKTKEDLEHNIALAKIKRENNKVQ